MATYSSVVSGDNSFLSGTMFIPGKDGKPLSYELNNGEPCKVTSSNLTGSSVSFTLSILRGTHAGVYFFHGATPPGHRGEFIGKAGAAAIMEEDDWTAKEVPPPIKPYKPKAKPAKKASGKKAAKKTVSKKAAKKPASKKAAKKTAGKKAAKKPASKKAAKKTVSKQR